MGVVRVPYITFYHRKWLAVTMSLSCTVSQTYQLFRLCDGMSSSTVSIYLVTNYNKKIYSHIWFPIHLQANAS